MQPRFHCPKWNHWTFAGAEF